MTPRRMTPRVRRLAITDAGLRCFVQWARLNDESIVLDPIIARGVLHAYAGVASAIDPGVAIAERVVSRAGFDPGQGLSP